jgi:uncharacterized membrane protein YcgQ (UPF0703/DUF1980 family)
MSLLGFSFPKPIKMDEVKTVETIKLSTIVLTVTPELYSFLTPQELDSQVVLRDGLDSLQALEMDDVLEIIEASILYNKAVPTLVH